MATESSSWPGAERDAVVTLAARLFADGADAEGYAFLEEKPASFVIIAAG